ncbi:hypothetical protein Q31b_30270 [Novipirellula aureliae]|uniref:Uncharacterized protein n=1 Tax=Novipirellula aureliae TaxID=2527966 RepID=A0A5C6E2H4_9BACT|nr:hypothetical protein Q31b_30270 [Novipirellula aureliae]
MSGVLGLPPLSESLQSYCRIRPAAAALLLAIGMWLGDWSQNHLPSLGLQRCGCYRIFFAGLLVQRRTIPMYNLESNV